MVHLGISYHLHEFASVKNLEILFDQDKYHIIVVIKNVLLKMELKKQPYGGVAYFRNEQFSKAIRIEIIGTGRCSCHVL